MKHHPTLLNPTCCTRLATMLHQTSSSTSSNVSFVPRSEQQCGICLAITFNSVARALALRLSVSIVMVYSLRVLRALPRQFKLQNGERAKSWISEPRKIEHAISLRTYSPSCVQSSQGHGANVYAGSFASQDPGTPLPAQWRPGSSKGSSHLHGARTLETAHLLLLFPDSWNSRPFAITDSDSIDNLRRNLAPTGREFVF